MGVNLGIDKEEIVPHVVSWAVAAIVFPATLSGGQFVFQQLGIAAHHKFGSPVAGFVSVCLAGSVATVTYIATHKALLSLHLRQQFSFSSKHNSTDDTNQNTNRCLNQKTPLSFPNFPSLLELLVHGLLSAYGVWLLGGSFRSFCPSSLFHLGAFAVTKPSGSIFARHEAYATPKEKGIVLRIGKTHGCHTCGNRLFVKKFNADHQPPKSVSKGPHRFYPQCVPCSNKQGGSLSRGSGIFNKTLIHHGTSLRKHHIWLPYAVIGSFLYANKELIQQRRRNANAPSASLSPRRWPENHFKD